MTIHRALLTSAALATALVLVGVSACGAPPPMSVTDQGFDKAMSAALLAGRPIAVTALEQGDWGMVCVVGEDRPANMLPGHSARAGEEAFDSLIDAAAYWSGPGSAFAFLYGDGVEVRPVTDLHVNMGQPINRCVSREQAILIPDQEIGWRFRGFPAES